MNRLSRRAILTSGVMSAVILCTAGCDVVRTDLSLARQPWSDAQTGFGDLRLDAFAYAILAPNPHNRQPWLIELDADVGATLYCDLDRRLPETDPFDRQIVIGLGAFLELLRIAGTAMGLRVETTPFPQGEPDTRLDARAVARIAFIEDESISRDPLFEAILDRRTGRVPFDAARPVEASVLNKLDAALRPTDGAFEWVNDARNVETLIDLGKRSWTVEATTKATFLESAELTRVGQKAVNANPDGISLAGPMMEALRLAGVLTPEKLRQMDSRAHAETISFYNNLIDSSQAFGLLTSADNARRTQLNIGAGWVRINLAATQAGLAMHPLSQSLQEFPEMAPLYEEIHDFAGIDAPGRVQGLFRFGYATAPPPAPRWSLPSRIRASA